MKHDEIEIWTDGWMDRCIDRQVPGQNIGVSWTIKLDQIGTDQNLFTFDLNLGIQRCLDRQTDKQIGRWVDRQANRQVDRQIQQLDRKTKIER